MTKDEQERIASWIQAGAILHLYDEQGSIPPGIVLAEFIEMTPGVAVYFELQPIGTMDQHHVHRLDYATIEAPHNLGYRFNDAEGHRVAYLNPLTEEEAIWVRMAIDEVKAWRDDIRTDEVIRKSWLNFLASMLHDLGRTG